jgi:hypothetical protein
MFLDNPIDRLLLLLLFRVKVQTQFLPLVCQREGWGGGQLGFCLFLFLLTSSYVPHLDDHS